MNHSSLETLKLNQPLPVILALKAEASKYLVVYLVCAMND